MAVIKAAHYGEVVAALMEHPVVIDMAAELEGIPVDKLAHVDQGGGPRFEFMLAANRVFDERGGRSVKLNLHIGAVAEALLALLKEGG